MSDRDSAPTPPEEDWDDGQGARPHHSRIQSAMTKSALRKHLQKLGRKGGQATANKLTAAQRVAKARVAAWARWDAEWERQNQPLDNMGFKGE